MGTEPHPNPSNSTLKLSFYTLPNQSPEQAGMLTPPLRPPATVPFLWEEVPGKPRSFSATGDNLFSGGGRGRNLGLPPRLQSEANLVTSPTTVLDGPYIARSASCTSQRSVKDYTSEKGPGSSFFQFHRKEKDKVKDRMLSFWGKRTRKVKGQTGVENGGRTSSSVLPYSASVSLVDDPDDTFTGVKITRFRRSGSFLNISNSTSHFWDTISGGIKQVVPWRFGKNALKDGRR
ncbi:uncharacterized protein At4g00950-like [Aristolochia californica]|uniref:uncharacterized protein At4g00950-like n=1 Tax=Aristolochia californica TaxID=171875 RepID=UPI0035D97EB2